MYDAANQSPTPRADLAVQIQDIILHEKTRRGRGRANLSQVMSMILILAHTNIEHPIPDPSFLHKETGVIDGSLEEPRFSTPASVAWQDPL
ncbi:hypothetical protein ACRALDRAFT_209583 [Sodiomyces alcalophilus JCM 7366]|uniref:uncharacterized protein n=1 Tax=Sodiomyces alcalophilus JCM 7366 TaxID=591952 RepID=UPI0039B4ADAD